MSIDTTLIDLASLGILRRLRRLEKSVQQEIDFVATAGGAQTIPIDSGAHSLSVFLNGIRQSGSSFQTAAGSVNIPANMGVASGDLLTLTYWL